MSINDNLSRAKELMKTPKIENLRYVCLELRMFIELTCYKTLKPFIKEISDNDLSKWQPKAVIKTLLQYDPEAEEDYSIAIKNGDKWLSMGKHKALTMKFIDDNYHKLGKYLHVEYVPLKDTNQQNLEEYLKELILNLEQYRFNLNGKLTSKIKFECNECGRVIVRNTHSFKKSEQNYIHCFNSQCNAEYEIDIKEGNEFTYALLDISFKCQHCNEPIKIPTSKLQENKIIKCKECKKQNMLVKDWIILKIH